MLSIDFNESSIGWLGESSGKFKLESTFCYNNAISKKVTYGLSQSVLAGNVYNKKDLIKKPYYLFQLLGNKNKQKIMRSDIPGNNNFLFKFSQKRKKINDTKFSKIFDNFNLEIKKQKVLKLQSFNDINRYYKKNNFIAKIKFKNFQNLDFEIEFPVNHINVLKNKKKWQIETGPILFPYKISIKKKFDLLPSFIAFNQLNFADVFYDYPFGFRRNKGIMQSIDCIIEIFTKSN